MKSYWYFTYKIDEIVGCSVIESTEGFFPLMDATRFVANHTKYNFVILNAVRISAEDYDSWISYKGVQHFYSK